MTAKFICAIEENTMILCERHAQAFEAAALIADTPHTIYEMEDEDAVDAVCHACHLAVAKEYIKRVEDESTPKIIMPGEYQ
jgi:hypothetical protein